MSWNEIGILASYYRPMTETSLIIHAIAWNYNTSSISTSILFYYVSIAKIKYVFITLIMWCFGTSHLNRFRIKHSWFWTKKTCWDDIKRIWWNIEVAFSHTVRSQLIWRNDCIYVTGMNVLCRRIWEKYFFQKKFLMSMCVVINEFDKSWKFLIKLVICIIFHFHLS